MNGKYKILVIEDDPLLAENICQILEAEGFIVEYAQNGKIGVEKVQTTNPDLIISDIMMPEMDGFEVLMELMSNKNTASIPLIFLTAKTDLDNLRKGMSLGAEDYLFKPFKIDDLLNAINVRLRKKELSENQLNEVKHQIFSKVHHDLRTPMVPILGLSDLIEEEEDLKEIKNMVKVIKQSGKKLFDRIEKFLIYNDLTLNCGENGKKSDKEALFSNQFIERIKNSLNGNIDANRVVSNVEPAELPISEWCLQILLKELIENALKFSSSEKQVFVEGKTIEEQYSITVTDYGIGMSEEEINSISVFNKFCKDKIADAGLGLGLAICKKIAQANNIDFRINSTPQQSTTCEINLKLKQRDINAEKS